MPTATLKYKLPEEQSEYKLAAKAGDLMNALYDIVKHLRDITKYKEYKTQTESTLAWELRDEIWNILKEHNIDPYEE